MWGGGKRLCITLKMPSNSRSVYFILKFSQLFPKFMTKIYIRGILDMEEMELGEIHFKFEEN